MAGCQSCVKTDVARDQATQGWASPGGEPPLHTSSCVPFLSTLAQAKVAPEMGEVYFRIFEAGQG